MIGLSWWETFIVQAAVGLLDVLATKISDPAELAALQAAIAFLQKLLSKGVAADLRLAQSTTPILD
jgi:hypothetical protein